MNKTVIKMGRLEILGPDSEGDFELKLENPKDVDYCYLNRAQANAVIIALGGTPPVKKQIRQLRKVRDI